MKSKFNCLSIIEMSIRQLYPSKLEEMKVMENETFHFVILEIQLPFDPYYIRIITKHEIKRVDENEIFISSDKQRYPRWKRLSYAWQ